METQEFIIGILLGLSLATAVGFRIFIPLLLISIASMAGYISLSDDFSWIGTTAALLVFAFAAIFELSAYLIPFVDNILDTIASPLAVIAGTIVMASTIMEMEPMLKWILAIVAGGGAAGLVQSLTNLTRATSSITTAGVGNPIFSIGETIASIGISILAILSPLIIGTIILIFLAWGAKKLIYKIVSK